MRDYGKISISIWNSRKFQGLTSDDARLAYLYLHTCPSTNSIGCFVLKAGYAAADLGWDAERYQTALIALSKALLIGFDKAESLVRIVDFLKHDPFTNKNHAAGAVKLARALPNSPEKTLLFNDIACQKFIENLDITDSPPIGLYIANRTPEPEPEPEPLREDLRPSLKKQQQQKSASANNLIEEVMRAVGVDPESPPKFWRGSVATTHVLGWQVAFNLTDAEVVEIARLSRFDHPGASPDGPKALDACMASFAKAKATASASGTAKGRSKAKPEAKPPASPEERLTFYADMVNSDRYIPPSMISNTMRAAMLHSGLVTQDRLREKGLNA